MKIYYYILVLLILSFDIYGQNKCNCDAMINWKFNKQVYVFDKPNGIVIDSIANDSINEDYLVINITETNENYFKVVLQLSIADKKKIGWIKKGNHIGTYARNYQDGTKLLLYSSPNKTSKVENIVNQWIQDLYVIEDCDGDWVKVRLTYKNKTYTGWLEKEMQCANPYTTCC